MGYYILKYYGKTKLQMGVESFRCSNTNELKIKQTKLTTTCTFTDSVIKQVQLTWIVNSAIKDDWFYGIGSTLHNHSNEPL